MPQQEKSFKEGYYRNINTLSLFRPLLLSGNVQSEHVAAGERLKINIIGTLTLKASVGQCYFQVTCNLNLSQQWKVFKKRYYRNLNSLRLCRQVLLSGNFLS